MSATICSPTPFASGWTGTLSFTKIDHLHGNQATFVSAAIGPAALPVAGPGRFFRGALSYIDVSYVAGTTVAAHLVFDVPPGTFQSGSYADSSSPTTQTAYAALSPLTKCP